MKKEREKEDLGWEIYKLGDVKIENCEFIKFDQKTFKDAEILSHIQAILIPIKSQQTLFS